MAMFKDFFKEDSKVSMTRLVTFITVSTAVLLSLFAGYLLLNGKLITELNYLIGILLTFAGGIKVGQKFAEIKENNLQAKQ